MFVGYCPCKSSLFLCFCFYWIFCFRHWSIQFGSLLRTFLFLVDSLRVKHICFCFAFIESPRHTTVTQTRPTPAGYVRLIKPLRYTHWPRHILPVGFKVSRSLSLEGASRNAQWLWQALPVAVPWQQRGTAEDFRASARIGSWLTLGVGRHWERT